MSKSGRKLLAALVIGLAGVLMPAFPERIKELMETMNKANIVSSIPTDVETADDVLERYARRKKVQKKKKKRKKRH